MTDMRMKKNRLTLKDSLFLGFCAVFIILMRAALRLHLNIPGHSMLFTLFFLMLARACVPTRFSATFTGLISGMMAVILGLGKGGPLILMKFLPPAMVIDILAMPVPAWYTRYGYCLLMAALAASTKFFSTVTVDVLIGMDPTVTLIHALTGSVFGAFFGMAGSLFVPPITAKLNAHGIISHHFGRDPAGGFPGEKKI